MSVFPIIQKPPHREPCNRCGWCCREEPCSLAEILMGQRRGACTALEYHSDGTTSCGLIVDPFRYTTAVKLGVVVGFLKHKHPDRYPSDGTNALILRLSLGNGTCDAYDEEEEDHGMEDA